MNVIARNFVEYTSETDLTELFGNPGRFGMAPGEPLFHIGEGSNCLFTQDFYGTVLRSQLPLTMTILSEDTSSGEVLVRVSASYPVDRLIEECIRVGLCGLENLSGIPGTVGAAAVQNVGAYGVEFGDLVHAVGCFDTQNRTFQAIDGDEAAYGYRFSRFKTREWKRYIILSVDLRLTRGGRPCLKYAQLQQMLADNASAADVRSVVLRLRADKLPDIAEVGSAGSFFKNPVIGREAFARVCERCGDKPSHHIVRDVFGDEHVKVSAAWLIDHAGFKGVRRGDAGVWPLQPLVLVNYGSATPKEIIELEMEITTKVEDFYGIRLSPEVEHL